MDTGPGRTLKILEASSSSARALHEVTGSTGRGDPCDLTAPAPRGTVPSKESVKYSKDPNNRTPPPDLPYLPDPTPY